MENNLSPGASAGRHFGLFIKRNSHVIAAFISSVIIFTVVCFIFGMKPFGDTNILRMDLYHQYGPLFAELYERIVGGDSLIYSWNTGMGSSFWGNFFNYLSSPFAVLILIFGHINMPAAIAAMILLKAATASSAFAYFIGRSTGVRSFAASAFGILYAFSGFFIAYYWNVMWLDVFAFFPLLILGIELIIKERKCALYISMLSLSIITSFYMGYMVSIFSVLYFLAYYFSNYKVNSYYDGIPYYISYKKNEQRLLHKAKDKILYSRFIKSGLLFAFCSVIAAGIVAFAIVPIYYILKNCSATSGTFPEKIQKYFSMFDFIANHFASVEPTIRSSGEDVFPNVYCGIASLILLPLYYLTKSVSIKEKLLHTGLLGILYVSFNTNFTNYIWHGFHFPNDLPFRFSFIYSFILVMLAYKTFIRLREISSKAIFASGAAVAIFLVLVEEIGSKNVQQRTLIFSIVFIVILTAFFAAVKNPKYGAGVMAFLLLITFSAESLIASTSRYSMGQKNAHYTGDYKEFQTVKNYIDEASPEFYRMELTDLRTRMDPAWYNYNGVSVFSSMAYEKLSNLQRYLGMYGNYVNSYTYNLQTPVYNAMTSIKYIVNNCAHVYPNPDLYKSITSTGKFTAYENRYALPLAFGVNSKVLDWNYTMSNPFDVQAEFFELASGATDVFYKMEVDSTDYDNMTSFDTSYDGISYYYDRNDINNESYLYFTLIPKNTDNCYIYLSSGNIDTVYIKRGDDMESENNLPAYYMDESFIVDLGKSVENEPIEVRVKITDENESGAVSFYAYGLNIPAFAEGYGKLKQSVLNVQEFKDTYIRGTYESESDNLLYTSIPYDESWEVKIDGKIVKKSDICKVGGSLMAVRVVAGKHNVEFTYKLQGFTAGLFMSIAAVSLLFIFILISKFNKKRRSEKLKRGHNVNVPSGDGAFPADTAHNDVMQAVDELTNPFIRPGVTYEAYHTADLRNETNPSQNSEVISENGYNNQTAETKTNAQTDEITFSIQSINDDD